MRKSMLLAALLALTVLVMAAAPAMAHVRVHDNNFFDRHNNRFFDDEFDHHNVFFDEDDGFFLNDNERNFVRTNDFFFVNDFGFVDSSCPFANDFEGPVNVLDCF